MPDAVDALLRLAAAPREKLTRTVYNIGAFSPSADGGRGEVVRARSRRREIDTKVDDASGRGSWTRGRPTWTTRPPAATGATPRGTTSSAASATI